MQYEEIARLVKADPMSIVNVEDYDLRWDLVQEIGIERIYQELNLQPLNLDDLKIITNHDCDEEDDRERELIYRGYIIDIYIRQEKYLHIEDSDIGSLPKDIGYLHSLKKIQLDNNEITSIPESIKYLSNLEHLNLRCNNITCIPSINVEAQNNIDRSQYTQLSLIPEIVQERVECAISTQEKKNTILSHFLNLKYLDLACNNINTLPDDIGSMENLEDLIISNNQISVLPQSISNLSKLAYLDIDGNPITDLSPLQSLSEQLDVYFLGVHLPSRYWVDLTKLSSHWLLCENNTEIRRVLIQLIGYARICQELGAKNINIWQEYTLLKIDGAERFYHLERREMHIEPMVLLKMTCPSTNHIHILRVPPEIESAEAAITWVNHGIHPDRFAVQT